MTTLASIGIGPMEITLILFVFIGIAIAALWLWSLIHCIKNEKLTDTNRIIGIVIILVLGPVGSLVYLFLPKDQNPPQ